MILAAGITVLDWQFLIFLLPMAAAILYVVLMASGVALGEHGDVSVDHGPRCSPWQLAG